MTTYTSSFCVQLRAFTLKATASTWLTSSVRSEYSSVQIFIGYLCLHVRLIFLVIEFVCVCVCIKWPMFQLFVSLRITF